MNMSQVRKLLNGNGGIPKTYNLILDGQTFTIDDDQLTQINNQIAALDPRHRAYLGGVAGTIASGSFVGNRAKNEISAPALSNLNDKEMEFLKSGKQNVWEALTDSNTYRAKEAINEALNIVSNVINNKASSSKKSSTNKLSADVINLDFNTDKDGKRYLSPTYYGAENRVRQILDHLKAGDASTYDVSDWPDFANVSGWIRDNHNGDYDAANKYFTDLWAKMRNPGFDEAEDYNAQDLEDVLRMFNINLNGTSNGSVKSDTQRQLESDFKNNPGLYDIIGENFVKDKDGVWRLKSDGTFNLGFLAPNQGIWFNDDFYKSGYGADGRYNALKGLTYYNGALYQSDSPILTQILNTSGGYNELVKNGDFTSADQIIRTRFTPEEMENPGVLSEDLYSSFINPGMRFSNLTGRYELSDGSMKNGQQLIQYLDLNDPIQDGPYTRYSYKFALLDNNGNRIRDDITVDDLSKIAGGTAKDLLTYKRVPKNNSGKYSNKYYEDITGDNGEYAGIRIYRDIDNPNSNVILHLDDMPGFANGKDVILPPEIAKILMSDQSWVKKIVSNTKARENFVNMLHSLGEGTFSKGLDNWWDWTTPLGLGRKTLDVDYGTSKLRTFMNDSQIKQLQQALEKASKGNKWDRRSSYFVDSPTEFRNGGKVQYITKLAGGGVSGGSTNATGVSEKRVSGKVVNPKNASSLSEIGSNTWSNEDTTDLIALGADLASLGLAFVPGANVASAVTGAASSLARYEADRGRGTKGAGAQLGLNLAMDAATLLPFAGGAAKAGKLTNAVKSALPVIIKAASVYGLGNAVITSAKKIAKGEKFTVRDVSNVVNGITAGIGVAKSGGFGKSIKKTTEKVFKEQNFKVGETDVKLTHNQLNDIAKSKDQAAALRSAISEQATNASKQEIASAAEKLLKSKKDGDLVLNVEKKKASKEATVEATGNWLHDWWYRTGTYNKLYNKKLVNEGIGEAPKIKGHLTSEIAMVPAVPSNLPPQTVSGFVVRPDGTVISSGLPNRDAFLPVPLVSVRRPVISKEFKRALAHYKNVQNYYNRISVVHPQWMFTKPETNAKYEEPNDMVRNPAYKNGGIIKAQSGLKFSVPSDITVPSNLSTNLINSIAYRPNIDWGTYINGKYTPFESLGPYRLKFDTPNKQYTDARTALIDAYGTSYDPNSKSYLSEYGAKEVVQEPVEETLPTANSNTPVAATEAKVADNDTRNPNGYNYNISDKTRWISPLLSTARYGLNAWAQRKYTEQAIKAINASRYSDLPVWQNLPSMSNPTLDRQLQQVHLERMAGMKPATADLIANNALWNQRESQLYDRENDIYGKQSAFQWDAAREGLNIMNQNLVNQIKVENENRAKTAALNSAIEQQKMAFIQMLNQSRQNALYEVQNNVANDRKALLAYEQNQHGQELQRQYDSYLRNTYADAANKYAQLGYDERLKYADLEDYILRNVPGSADDITRQRNKILNSQLQWQRDNALNYNYGILAGRKSSAGNRTFKKGGRVNGTTRYTLAPDERIWVDNNKAAHAGVAKISDNVIKLILRALK